MNRSLVVSWVAALSLVACSSGSKKAEPAPNAAPAAKAAAAPPPMSTLSIRGFFTKEGFGLDPVFCVDEPSAGPKPGPFKLTLLDAQGKELASYPFSGETPERVAGEPTPDERSYFKLLVPKIGFEEVVLETPGVPTLRKRVSANAPEIALEPVTEASFIANKKVHLAWQTRDADGDRVFLNLETSMDDGKTWRALPGTYFERSSVDLDLRWLKPSDTTRLRASVSDGLRCARDEYGPFVVPKRPPMVRIRQTYKPQIKKTDTLAMRADAGSENGAVDEKAILWTSSLDGEIGRGLTISFVGKDRSVGKHTITATFTDTAGLTSSHQLDVEVVP